LAITFVVSDGAASDSERVVITAGSANAPPALAPIGDQSVNVGQTLELVLTANDPEGGALAFTATGLPAGASLQDFGDGSAQLRYAPTQAGRADVTVTVSDLGTPPESASETFALTALAPSANGPALRFATWDPLERELVLVGDGAAPDSLVEILEPSGDAVLADAHANASGVFDVVARTFLAPCSVRARSASGELGLALTVLNAPADCGRQVFTRAKLRWRCRDQMLTVRGGRAPVSGEVTVSDPASGAMLASGTADGRGRFAFSAPTAAPANVRLRVTSGAGTWMVGSLPVRGADVRCAGKGDEDDEDDDD
jgi:hypothetical protein